MLFDRRCPVCGQTQRTVCRPCVDRFELIAEHDADGLTPAGLSQIVPLFRYDEVSARLVLAAKNGGRRDLLRWSGELLGGQVQRRSRHSIDIVTWVPAHPEQRATRGYDQGEVVAKVVARQLGRRARPLLQRRGGASRKGLARADRLAGPDVTARRSTGGVVLVVDDVMTTGTSLRRCAAVLADAGATRVVGAVVAASWNDNDLLPARSDASIYIGSSSGIRLDST